MLDRINPRERIVLLAAAVLLVPLLIWGLLLSPYSAALKKLETRAENRQGEVAEVESIRAEILALRTMIDKVRSEGDETTLFSHVEAMTVKSGVKANLAAIRPQQPTTEGEYRLESVELKLDKLSLEQLVRFLTTLQEHPIHVPVRSLKIRPRFEDKSKIDVSMTLIRYQS